MPQSFFSGVSPFLLAFLQSLGRGGGGRGYIVIPQVSLPAIKHGKDVTKCIFQNIPTYLTQQIHEICETMKRLLIILMPSRNIRCEEHFVNKKNSMKTNKGILQSPKGSNIDQKMTKYNLFAEIFGHRREIKSCLLTKKFDFTRIVLKKLNCYYVLPQKLGCW